MTNIKNLYYGITGFIAYYKQAKAQDAIINPNESNRVDIITLDDAELSIHHIPAVNKLGVAFGGLMKNGVTKQTVIIVDDNFYSLNKPMQEALICHEIGHFVKGHLEGKGLKYLWEQCVFLGKLAHSSDEEKNLLIANTMKMRDYSQELEADAYAVEKCGVHAVIALLTMFHTIDPTNAEVIARYRNIVGEDPVVVETPFQKAIREAQTISLDDLDEEELFDNTVTISVSVDEGLDEVFKKHGLEFVYEDYEGKRMWVDARATFGQTSSQYRRGVATLVCDRDLYEEMEMDLLDYELPFVEN